MRSERERPIPAHMTAQDPGMTGAESMGETPGLELLDSFADWMDRDASTTAALRQLSERDPHAAASWKVWRCSRSIPDVMRKTRRGRRSILYDLSRARRDLFGDSSPKVLQGLVRGNKTYAERLELMDLADEQLSAIYEMIHFHWSPARIAAVLGVPTSTVRSRYRLAVRVVGAEQARIIDRRPAKTIPEARGRSA